MAIFFDAADAFVEVRFGGRWLSPFTTAKHRLVPLK
jgi:hypothetical protein